MDERQPLVAHESVRETVDKPAIEDQDPAVHGRVLNDFNDTAVQFTHSPLIQLFERQVAKSPSNIAMVFPGHEVTYAELETRSNQLAWRLIAEGVGPENIVAICLDRSTEMIVAILATLKSGAAYLPLDPKDPPERLAVIIEDAKPKRVLTTSRLAENLAPAIHGACLHLDAAASADLARFPLVAPTDAERAIPLRPGHAAYLIYTSGSTGTPKGVVITNSAINNSIQARIDFYGEDIEALNFSAPIAFDISVAQIFWTFSRGAKLVVALDPAVEALAVEGARDLQKSITHLMLPSNLYANLLMSTDRGHWRSLRCVVVGGDALPAQTVRLHRSIHEGAHLFNEYGPSEATIWSTVGLCGKGPDGEVPAIGAPIANTRAYVLDAELLPCPLGATGELYIAGAGLARGYWRRPGLTAERFIANPFAREPGERLYRTGDLAAWREDGELLFHGRSDHQIKVRGCRIEPGEIEAALLREPGISQAAVMAREDAAGDKRLMAYLVPVKNVPEQGQELDLRDLRQRLSARLPDYMIPAAFIIRDALPLTPNGKLDRQALPLPESSGSAATYVAPTTTEQLLLCQVVAELLGLERVGLADNFFYLGGHSLLATRLAAQIRNRLGRELPIRTLFDTPVLGDLAHRLRSLPKTGLPLTPQQRPAELPLSFAQARLWFLHQLEGANANYNIPVGFRLRGALDETVLERALNDLLARHESLRTLLVEHDGKPQQRILATDAGLSPLHILTSSPGSIERDLATAAAHRFDIATEIPLRATLFRLGPDDHALLLLVHHTAADGWSVVPLLDDLAQTYAARLQGQVPAFKPLPVQYADYALWQHTLLGSEQDPASSFARQLGYWTQQLAGLPAELSLLTDRRRPLTPSFAGGGVRIPIAPEVRAKLQQLGRAQSATLFMILHTALAALYTRLGAGVDIPIGSPIAGRTDAALDNLVGFFVNTLVFRTQAGGNPSFAELLSRVRTTCLEAYAHQDVPFERLVEHLDPPRAFGRQPLFQTMLVLQNNEPPSLNLPEVTAVALPSTAPTTKFDLTFTFIETEDAAGGPGQLTGELEYSADLFNRASAERLAGRLARLLEQVATDPNTPLQRLEILTADERRRLLHNSEDGAPVPEPTLSHLFEEQAAKTPGNVALICEGEDLHYAKLEARSNQLAWKLIADGIGPEDVVAICIDRSLEMVVAVLATLKAGAAYLPLDPDYPADRLNFMIQDARPKCLLTKSGLGRNPPDVELGTLLQLDAPALGAELAAFPTTAPTDAGRRTPLRPQHPAYIIYTSGSTGTPKGVAVSHRNVVRLFEATGRWFDFTHNDTWTLFHSYAFDFSVWELWGALLNGGRLVIVPKRVATSAEAFRDLLAQHSVTVLNQTPSSFYRLMQADEEAGNAAEPLALRTVIFGGEALDLSRLERWYSRRPSARPRLVNMYGITETTVHVTCAPLDRELAATAPVNLIGVGLSDLRVYVLDAGLQPCAIGVVGGMYIAGAGLARGYLNRPGLTAERFVANPFAREPGDRLYRSGDLASWRDDGNLLFHGRADQQIKIRGFRIEPGEIEAALLRESSIGQAAVITRGDRSGDQHLVAYLVPRQHAQGRIDLVDLRGRLAERLPEYMIPGAFVILDALPLTANGKLDRGALPAPEGTGLGAVYRAPGTPEEILLCELVAELLGASRVGLADNFFHLGGHSLLATRLAARIRTRLGRELPIRTVFETPVLGDLARTLRTLPKAGLPLAPQVRPPELPLSFAQARLWFLQQLEGANPNYNIPVAVRLQGGLDTAALEEAINDLRARHESLRTLLVEHDGRPQQRILAADAARSPLPVLTSSPQSIERDLAAAAAQGFDLASELPLRATLFRVTPQDHALLLVAHHSAADGWSLAPLLDDLSQAYAARRQGKAPAFPPLPVQYADYTLWQRALLGTEQDPDSPLARQIAYWRQQLAALPAELDLPTDRPRPLTPSYRGGAVAIAVTPSLYARLQDLGRQHGATLFMILQAALGALLTKLGAGSDIPIGSPIAGRTEAALDRLVGFFVNTLVLRTDTSGNPSFVGLLARARATCLAAYAHQDLPFERLVELLSPPRALGRQPLFQTMLVLQNNRPPSLALPGVNAVAIASAARTTKFDLTFTFTEIPDAAGGPGELSAELEYSADLFDQASAERLAACLTHLLEQVTANPVAPLHRLDILEPAERHRLLHDFNDTAAAIPTATLVDLYEHQVARTPDNIALVFQGQELSYAQLEARSNQLAWKLIANGIGPEDIVANCLERSPEMIVAVLATLKAGAAYLPLDPDYPAERLAFMLADAHPKCLLTTSALDAKLSGLGNGLCLRLDAPQVSADLAQFPNLPLWAPTDADRTTPLRPHHPAYLIYTSGSTGTPKGVVIAQQSITHYIDYVGSNILARNTARMPLFTSPVFDLTLTTLFAPLCSGGAIHIVAQKNAQDALAEIFVPQGAASAVKLTPSHISLLSALPPSKAAIATAIVGGEALTAAQVKTLQEHCPGIRVFNEYGPTEATIGAVGGYVEGPDIHIGTPYANTRACVLDAVLGPCPVGVTGELYLAGVGLARGYWQRPGLTAERFIANPLALAPGERLYRTGDLASWRADGKLLFHGRADQQVKIRGFRIEPGEIEASLLNEPGIAQAAVIAREDTTGDKRLVAYLVPRQNAQGKSEQIDLTDLRRHLDIRMPEYMIPAAFVILDALPLTSNGKLDRQALPAPEGSGLAAGYAAPTTPEETLLCDLVSELLGLERVGLADNFFHLGGHSLLATRLAARIRSQLGRELPLRTIFATPVLGDLARALHALRPPQDQAAPLLADAAAAHAPFPLTPVQEAYWLGRQSLVELGEVACHVYAELRLRDLDLERFIAAWRAVIDRHPMLRAVIASDGTQRILAEVPPFAIAFADYSQAPAGQAEAAAAAVREEMSHQVLPADRWPLFEARVTRLTRDDWRLHLSIDALILDGESNNLLLQEVFDLYQGRSAGGLPSSLTFRDYVLHLQAPSPATEQARAYWQARLDTLPPAPALPLAVDPARLAAARFGRHHARLAPAVWNTLKVRAAAAGLTPSNLLLAAYAEVLGTWARSDDFTLNLTVGDRRPLHPEVAGMLGVFTNLTPLEIRGACRGPFRARAHAQQQQLARDLDHRALSGVEVQRLLAQRAGDPRAGLLPVVFTSVIGEAQVDLPPEAEVVHSITQTPQTWLDHKVYESDGGLGIDWDAPLGLFPAGLLGTMLAAFVSLLEELAASDAAWEASDRSLIPAAQRALISSVNATAGPLPADLLQAPVFAAAQAHPEATAVIGEDYTLSFGELTRRARTLAQRLHQALDPAGGLVAIVMEKGWEQIIAVLAVLEAGGTFLPISAGQPDQRIGTILRQAGARFALTQERAARGGSWQDEVTLLEVTAESLGGSLPPRLPQGAAPDDPAYVIYTSGSTGTPKGVTISHRAARNTLADLSERFAISATDRVLWVSSLEFDLSIFDLFGILGVGGAVVVPPPGGHQNPLGWAQMAARHGVTIWNSVPALAELMLSAAGESARALLSSLRLLMLSGDWIPVSLPGRLRAQVPGCRIYSLGGATEASIWSIFHPIERVDPDWASIPYGKPLRNQTFHVLKDDFTPCPVHTTGKLFIGGAGLALGYWNDPAQTQARFLIHPRTGERLYDTGDLGRYQPDGNIEFLGREDHQVKLRGFRIELGEIEAALLHESGIAQGAVVARADTTGDKRMVAYLVPTKDEVGRSQEIDLHVLRRRLAERLPEYMLPAAFVVLDALPVTPNGKVDRQALPAPETSGLAAGFVPPTTPEEALLCELVAELLGLARAGLADNFFHLGGDSISSIRLVSRAREGSLLITPRDVFHHPVLGDLAHVAQNAPPGPTPMATALVALEPAEIETFEQQHPDLEDIWPLTPLQEGLLFHAQYDREGEDPYLVQLVLELEGELEPARLRRALDALLGRHPNLRVSFQPNRVGKPLQIVHGRCAMPWREHDLSGARPGEGARQAAAIEAEDRHTRFRLDQAPAIRACLLRLESHQHRLLLTQHHLLGDGWSGPILLQDLLALYRHGGDGSALPPPPAFKDYLGWVQNQDKQAARDAWRTYLAGIEAATRLAPTVAEGAPVEQAQYEECLPAEFTARLEAFARQHGLTLATVLQGVWTVLLSRLTNQSDVVYGQVSSGRQALVPGIERMLGLLITTTPARVKLPPTESALAFLARLQREQAALLPHQHLSLTEIHKLAGREALFDTLFTYENYPVDAALVPAGGDDLPLRAVRGHNGNHYPLSFAAIPGAQLGLRLHYRADLLDQASAARLVARLTRLLEQVTADPNAPLQRLDILEPEERRLLLHDFNDTAAAIPTGTLVDLFERQVARTPDHVALVFHGQELTYAQLEARSNQLAWKLIASGIGPEDIVAISLERSPEMIVAVLATLKAGAAYLPLDPDYPAERLAFMLADARPQCLLATTALDAKLPGLGHGLRLHLVDSPAVEAELSQFPRSAPTDADRTTPLRPHHPAYLIYTSGSTGTPKGVLVAHRGIPGLATAQSKRLAVTEVSRALQLASFSFDAALSELAMALCCGAALVIASGDERSGDALDNLLASEKITHATITPTVLKTLTPGRPASLQALIVASEPCPARIAELWAGRYRLFNAYGPTESTVCATMSGPIAGEGAPPIGAPIDNVRAYVLGRDLEPRPVGTVGELYLAGAGLARSYWKRAGMTAERFVANPYAQEPGERLYRTGDLASWRGDGKLLFHGRVDQQVKIRGFRIELGEIEAALLHEQGIAQAAVIAREDTTGDKRLVAYLVPTNDEVERSEGIDLHDLRRRLAARLPEYMLPGSFVVLDALPVTANSKVDRQALPAPETSGLAAGYVPPTTPEEVLLCELTAELLNLERAGLADNFFHLGGDSISSIRLVSRARERGLLITPREVFHHPVLGDLVRVAQNAPPGPSAKASGGAEGALPATPITRRLLTQNGPWTGFSQAMVFQAPAHLDETALVATLQALLDHHDALRLRVTADGSLKILPVGSVSARACLRRISLACLDAAQRQMALRRAGDDATTGLDPRAGILLQAVWAAGSTDEPGQLLLAIHHLAVDGVSWHILGSDLAQAYTAASSGQAIDLPAKTTSFRHWAQRLASDAPQHRSELPFWQAMAARPAPPLLTGTLDSARDSGGGARHLQRTLPVETTVALLTSVTAAFHARINDVLLTALVLATAAWRRGRGETGALALRLDLEGHGRELHDPSLDLTRTVGWFTSLYPLHLDPGALDLEDALAGGDAAGRALKRIKEQLRAVPGQGLGYGLLRYLDPDSAAQLEAYSAPQIAFNYLGRFSAGQGTDWQLAAEADTLTGSADPASPLDHPIALNAITRDTPAGPVLSATWSFAPALLSEAGASRLADAWGQALTALARHAAQPEAGGFTPSDFALVALEQEEIETLEGQHPGLEDIWPLTPLQEGLLFHAQYDREGEDPYLVQLVLEFEGELEPARLRRALDALLGRHPNLRVSFQPNRVGKPLQIVHGRCAMPWREHDLSGARPGEGARQAAAIEAEDRHTRFGLDQAPAIRACLLRLESHQHRLLLTQHHLLGDGWSGPILLQDLLALYRHGGDGSALPPPPAFKDCLGWVQNQDKQAARDAWRTYLAGIEAATRLAPTVAEGAPVEQAQYEECLPAEFTARLEAFARQHGLTLATVLQGVWTVLLSRLTNQSDVVYGQVSSGRQALVPGIERMLGLLITTTPARVKLPPTESALAFLARLQREQAALLPHQHLSLTEIHKLAGREALFDTLFTYENYPVDAAAVPAGGDDLPLRAVRGHNGNHYPLSFAAIPGAQLGLRLHYRADLLDQASAARLVARLTRLLEQVTADPNAPLQRLDILEPEEWRLLLRDFNDTAAAIPTGTLVDLFERQVARTPDHVALVFHGQELTYAQLEARSNQLAWKLIASGIGPEDIVAIGLERSPEMIVAVLATLKAGAAYLPLDPEYPAGRLAFMFADARPRCLLTSSDLGGRLPDTGHGLHLHLDSAEVSAELSQFPRSAPTDADRTTPLRPHHPAYLIYTSGSTGTPKGVVIAQQSITHYIDFVSSNILAQNSARMPLFTSPVFDLTLTTLFAPLCSGGHVQLVAQKNAQDALGEIFVPQGTASAVKLTPSHIALLNALPRSKTAITTAIVGGEALTAAQVKTLHEHCPGIRVFNEYGPTEATIGAVGGYVDGQDIHIGTPYANTRAYVLDAGLAPCALGVIGELYLAGVGLARGYWQRPGLTAERFIANRFALEPGERLYRTGDLASWRADGKLLFHGRADEQVKIRGFRIEPGEIETSLLHEQGIAQATVIVREDTTGDKRLVAYLVPRQNAQGQKEEIDLHNLRQRLAARLPEYMIPAAFVLLNALPLTSNGKLDRQALPAPEGSGLAAGYVAPTTPEEKLLCDLVAELLGFKGLRENCPPAANHPGAQGAIPPASGGELPEPLPSSLEEGWRAERRGGSEGDSANRQRDILPAVQRVGLADNFFHLGGHSLLAARLAAEVREKLGRDLSIRTIFEYPVIQELAKQISLVTDSTTAFGLLLPIRNRGSLPPLFCLHPEGGLCWSYTNLLRHSTEEQPIYGIQARGFTEDSNLPETLDEVIGESVKQIRAQRAQGPYRLLGWSFGGILAHRIATRLQAEGERIDRLIIFDTYPPSTQHDHQMKAEIVPRDVWRDLARATGLTVPPQPANTALDVDAILALAREQTHILGSLPIRQLKQIGAVMENNSRLMRSGMKLDPFDGDMFLYVATRHAAGFDESRMNPRAWEPFCRGSIRTITVDAAHNELMSPEALERMGELPLW